MICPFTQINWENNYLQILEELLRTLTSNRNSLTWILFCFITYGLMIFLRVANKQHWQVWSTAVQPKGILRYFLKSIFTVKTNIILKKGIGTNKKYSKWFSMLFTLFEIFFPKKVTVVWSNFLDYSNAIDLLHFFLSVLSNSFPQIIYNHNMIWNWIDWLSYNLQIVKPEVMISLAIKLRWFFT